MDADGSCSGSCGGLGWAPPVEIESCSRHHSSAQLSMAQQRSVGLEIFHAGYWQWFQTLHGHSTTAPTTTPQQSAVPTTAPPPSCAYISVYLQISTLHLVNTYSVRRYLHCTVRPTSSSSTKYAVVSMETEESLTSGLQYAPGRGLGAALPRT